MIAALLIVISLIAGLSATIWQARRANQERAAAQQRFDEARKVSNSLLFEIYPQIRDIEGATAAKETLVKRALEYLDNLSQQPFADESLTRELAAAYEKVGDIQGMPDQPNLGDLSAALLSYRRAQTLREHLVASSSQSDLLDELATNYEHQGMILWWLSRTDEAAASYDMTMPIRRRLVAENPLSTEFRKNLAGLEMNRGDIPAWNGKPAEAMTFFSEAKSLLDQITLQDPAKTEAREMTARCLIRIGTSNKDLGNFEEAIRSFEAADEIFRALGTAKSGNYDLDRGQWETSFGECEAYISAPDPKNAMTKCTQLAELSKKLNKKDHDALSNHDLASSYSYLGEALLINGDARRAKENFLKAYGIDQELEKESPDNDENRRAAAIALFDIGKAELMNGNLDAADKYEKMSLETLQTLSAEDTEDSNRQFDLASTLEQLGDIALRKKNLSPPAISSLAELPL